ncbi:GL22719 [Drosophila persimilis]|uniref:GL22719 n=1 Tax=Drosophila persimilis TaxID=7234 RepID=B4GZV1_DROPE|nr:GL22719 [Drosophila persimilis]
MDKQFSFPEEPSGGFHSLGSTTIPTTPVVSYLDPYTQQNYGYVPTATPPTLIQYQREQPEDDQAYTVQSTLLVGSHQQHQQPQRPRPGYVDDVYLKRPGYVFDESPSSAVYRRPTKAPPALPAPPTTASHKISYDSHDYPPPSYAAEQTSNFVPQTLPERPLYNRQDINDNRPAVQETHRPRPQAQAQLQIQHQPQPKPQSRPPSSSNYANNFDNYLQRPPPSYQSHSQSQSHAYTQPQPQLQAQSQPHISISSSSSSATIVLEAGPTTYRPSQSSSSSSGGGGVGGGGGLATLASLFSSTQQYAPQFTNLLLGTASSTQSQSSPLGSLLGAFAGNGYQQHQQQQQQYQKPQQGRPPNTQLIRALENIARNDDLECVPKVLCQMIAGQTLRGQLPGFITSPAIANFLTGFPVASPALIYGRAALLGLSGGERSCLQSYEKCPKNEMEIIHYLNNHRGGFFKFFSEPEEQPVAAQQSESGAGSLFSILSALTGGGGGGGQSQVYTTPRPVARPTQRPSTDIASGIGSFFSQVLSEYLNGVEYQRRRRRRRRSLLPTEIKRAIQTDDARLMPVDFHDEEDGLDTQSGRVVKFQDDDEAEAAQAHTELIGVLQFPEDEGRVLNFKGIESEEYHQDGAIRFPDATPAEAARDDQSKIIREFNRDAAQRKLRFPPEGGGRWSCQTG